MTHFWLRSEDRQDEFRTPISPTGAQKLLKKGFKVTVENCEKRIFKTSEYQLKGCKIVKKGSWVSANEDTIIIGLKEINQDLALNHKHIMFAHAFKKQTDSVKILNNFKQNKGILYDLEYLKDKKGKRVAAFGYYAGYSGAFIGLNIWFNYKNNTLSSGIKVPFSTTRKNLVDTAISQIKQHKKNEIAMPKIIVIGAAGRVGTGASDFFKSLGIILTEWDFKETSNRKSFPEILEHDIFVNCVLSSDKSVKFLRKRDLINDRKLVLISDVSCDPGSDFNTIPLYDKPSSFKKPFQYIIDEQKPLILTAIDNLPAMLPKESSLDFENQLLPYLFDFNLDKTGVWRGAEKIFYDKLSQIQR